MKYSILNYENWSSFKADVVYDICKRNSFPHERYIFRGQSNESWKLMASFDRLYKDLKYDERKEIEENLLNSFRNSCVNMDGTDRIKNYDEFQLMSLGQHYGLPTRLLDWTYSIYVAAFFSFSQAMNISETSNIAIWVIDRENEIWKGGYGVSVETKFTEENERQRYQRGVFTLNQSVDRSLDDFVETCASRQPVEGALYKIILPASEWKDALNDLDMMNINYYSLYRGMEGCAKAAVIKELLTRKL